MNNQENTEKPTETQENTQNPSETNQTKTDEPKREKRIINEVEDRKTISEGKKEGDKQLQIDVKQAIRVYEKILQLVKDTLQDYEGDKSSEFFKFLCDHNKSIHSNLALCNTKLKNFEKAIEYDLTV